MRYGVSDSGDGVPSIDGSDHYRCVVNDINIALYKGDGLNREVFPPSKGSIAITGSRVICSKQRATRVQTTLPIAGGPPALVDQVVVDEPGRQWFTFDVDQVFDLGRTMLLLYKVEVEDEEGTYEVSLGRGSRTNRFISLLDRLRKEEMDERS